MKSSKFWDAQKAFIIRQGEDGTPVEEVCGRLGSARRPTMHGRRSTPGWRRPK